MNYRLVNATKRDILKLIEYKLESIFDYAENLSLEEINQINDYVKSNVPKELNNYKVICIDDKKVGCLLITNKDDGVLLDEIYLEEKYRNKGIGTSIIKEILSNYNIVYLWVYKLNTKALSLYKKLGFKIINETKTRYYMKY